MTTKLFALDIGTRSIVGIILEEHKNSYHVADFLMKEHKERAMVDGQIHNVMYVAELIQEIKSELEEKHGPLTKVSVAAAGRSLKTERASVSLSIKNRPVLTEEDISRLELQAVQQAQQQLLQQKEETQVSHYYCVGYSVLHYLLDGEEIGNLLDQQGEEATIEVIATFLPRVVVESLIAALKRADLEMEAMTLEPIAAINVLVPATMRRLNVVLVDIGAGTSDIAITNNGTIVAYGMVPTAGDEITEALSDHFLLDFPIAERAKRQINTSNKITIQDILGFDQHIAKKEVLKIIMPAVEHLAESISSEILRLNNNEAPKAVMLVGGGSLTPNLTSELGRLLELPDNRIAIRGIDAIQNLTRADNIPASPELVTPIGIAIAAKKSPIQYMSLTVNNQTVRLFELKEMTVGDAFLAANVRAKQLYGRPGHGLSIEVNGQDIFIPGEHGKPAEILVNGEPATTKTLIKSGDAIQLVEGKDGDTAFATVKDLVDDSLFKTITIQDRQYKIEPKIYLNGEITSLDAPLIDRDKLTFEASETAEDILKLTNNQALLNKLAPFQIFIEDKAVLLPQFSSKLYINKKPSKLTYPVKNGDDLTIEQGTLPTVEMIVSQIHLDLEEKIRVTFQKQQLELVKTIYEIAIDGMIVQPHTIVQNNSNIMLMEKESKGNWVFQDVFRVSDWKLPTNFAGQFVFLRNGQTANFETPIFGGDTLEIQLIEQSTN